MHLRLFKVGHQGYDEGMKRRFLFFACVAVFALASCHDDSSSDERAARFSSSSKPAPNPQLDPLSDFVRTSSSEGASGSQYKYPLYSEYAGEDIVQLTGVSGRTLLLCFGASWCPHSQKMKESLRKLAESEQGTVQAVMVDADAYADLAEKFHVSKVPTTFIYVEGIKLQSVAGAYSTDVFRSVLKRALIPSDKNKRSH